MGVGGREGGEKKASNCGLQFVLWPRRIGIFPLAQTYPLSLSILPRFIFKSANFCGSPVLSYPIPQLTHTPSYPPRFFLACPNQPNRASRITVCFWMTLKYYPPLHGLGSDTYFIPPYAGFQIASSYFRHPDTTLPFEALKYDDVRELLSSERVIASSSRK